jgi:hypothetical protein
MDTDSQQGTPAAGGREEEGDGRGSKAKKKRKRRQEEAGQVAGQNSTSAAAGGGSRHQQSQLQATQNSQPSPPQPFWPPLVINTHGWVQGVGLDLTSMVLRAVQPTYVLQV